VPSEPKPEPPPTDIRVVPVGHLDLRFVPRAWPFADQRRAEIAAHFADLRDATPDLWNGRVLLLHRWALAHGGFEGDCLETDYASMLAWRDWGFPDNSVRNCFAQGALRSADGAFLLGVMSPHTANPGQIYFPSGTPGPSDVRDGALDMDANVMRELAEETGLGAEDVEARPGWHAVFAGPRIGLMKVLQSRQREAALRSRIMDFLARQERPELAGIHVARGPADLHAKMPSFVPAFLHAVWETGRN